MTTEQRMQTYVEETIYGFAFKNTKFINFTDDYFQYIGKIGKIVEVERDSRTKYSCRVTFPDNEELWYPMDNIDDHLVIPRNINLQELFNQIKSL